MSGVCAAAYEPELDPAGAGRESELFWPPAPEVAGHLIEESRTGRQRTSGRTTAERRTRHTEEVTYTIDITKSNLPQWDIAPET